VGRIQSLPKGTTFESHIANVLQWKGEVGELDRDTFYTAVTRYSAENNCDQFALWLAVQGA
jgi:hypothetical protein